MNYSARVKAHRSVSSGCLQLKLGLRCHPGTYPRLEVGVQQHVSVRVDGKVVAVGSKLRQSSESV